MRSEIRSLHWFEVKCQINHCRWTNWGHACAKPCLRSAHCSCWTHGIHRQSDARRRETGQRGVPARAAGQPRVRERLGQSWIHTAVLGESRRAFGLREVAAWCSQLQREFSLCLGCSFQAQMVYFDSRQMGNTKERERESCANKETTRLSLLLEKVFSIWDTLSGSVKNFIIDCQRFHHGFLFFILEKIAPHTSNLTFLRRVW